jgi:hypothetical protein
MKAAIGQIREEYAFSERRACGLLAMAVTTYRYRSLRSDEPLRTRLVELAREKPRFGYGTCQESCVGGWLQVAASKRDWNRALNW